ncbi:MAG: hypothetical protein ACK5A2_09385 [Bacteroidota bacterium]
MTPADSSQILIRPADSSLYVRYKRAWQKVGAGGTIGGSGTTNYIPKFTSSSAIGNSQIFDDGTNVGIGTTSPNAKLDVNGVIRSNDRIIANANNANGTASINTFFNNISIAQFCNLSNIANATQYGFMQGNDGANYIGGSKNVIEFGNVGIGTASPAVKLDVNGSISLASGNNLTWGGIYGANIPTIAGQSGAGAYLQFYPAGSTSSEKVRFHANGAVTINTTTDNGVDKLQVSGSMNVSTLATTNNLSVTTNATVGGTLRVTGTTTLGTTNTGAINASSVDAGTGNGSFGNVYSGGIVQMLGVNVKYRNISATYTATTSDDYFINITSGTFTLNLPTAATPYGQVYVIKNSGTGTITVDPNGSQTIDGATTFTMNVQNGSITIIGDGSNWKIVSKYL